jgi:uncharacterized protein
MASSEYDPRYLRGIEHFNRGEYFQSHEVWEDLWRAVDDPAKTFYKGLIQAAVSIYHRQRGNRHGADKLLASSRACLQGFGAGYLGLDVEDFLLQLAGCRSSTVPEERRPRIVLSPEPC